MNEGLTHYNYVFSLSELGNLHVLLYGAGMFDGNALAAYLMH